MRVTETAENGERGTGNEHGERETEKWEQSRELEMKLPDRARVQS